MISFGPVPSRRLGRSLGINNIPPKVCTYSCVYCQVGKTTMMQIDRTQFYDPEEIYTEVSKKLEQAQKKGESVDYLTFVPDGEATLDANLALEIKLLKSLGLKIAIITNGALIWRKDVRADLAKADWKIVRKLMAQDLLVDIKYQGKMFIMRKSNVSFNQDQPMEVDQLYHT